MANERLTSRNMSITGMIVALSEDNPGAANVIMQLIDRGELMLVLLLDSKHLYGSKIWELYSRICGGSLDRFIYHLTMELPDQETGQLSTTGPYAADLTVEKARAFWDARKFGKPGSFWALETPPTKHDYAYPIM